MRLILPYSTLVIRISNGRKCFAASCGERQKQGKEVEDFATTVVSLSRRNCGLGMSLLVGVPIASSMLLVSPDSIKVNAEELLHRYTDSKEGFTLLVPSSCVKVEKAGATVLFEDSNSKSNNIGVVVNPVRLSSLAEFGTPEFVAEKLIQAEKRKESTNDAELIGVSERSGHGGLQVYEFEYKVDSSRGGMKRIYSAAFVHSKKIYLLNVSYSDRLENPLQDDTVRLLQEVIHSFDTTF